MSGREPAGERRNLVAQALRLEWLTLAWMAVEAAVAIAAGVVAHSLSLTAFGLDSLIELVSASLVLWRLDRELRFGQDRSEKAETLARQLGGALLLALALYIAIAAGWSLWNREGEAFSWPGLAIAGLAIPVMLALSRKKLAIAEKIGSRALRLDAVEGAACLWLSAVVVVGLLAQGAFGVWWIDAATSLAILWFLVREGYEAWRAGEPS